MGRLVKADVSVEVDVGHCKGFVGAGSFVGHCIQRCTGGSYRRRISAIASVKANESVGLNIFRAYDDGRYGGKTRAR